MRPALSLSTYRPLLPRPGASAADPDPLAPAADALVCGILAAHGGDRAVVRRTLARAATTLAQHRHEHPELRLVMACDGMRLRMTADFGVSGPVPLRGFMAGTHGPLLAGRFETLMEEMGIAALTVRGGIDLDQLCELAEQIAATDEAPLAVRLLEAGVLDAQLVQFTDLIAPKVTLAWRVRVGLSRIPLALRAAPVLAQTTGEPYAQARRRYLHDIASSLRGGGEVRSLLEHLPRALRATFGRAPTRAELDDLGPELLDALAVDERLVLAGALLTEMQRIGPTITEPGQRGGTLTNLRWVGRSLKAYGDRPGVATLLEQLGESRVLTADELPDGIGAGLRERELQLAAARSPGEALEALSASPEPADYAVHLRALLRAFPLLARTGRRAEVAAVVNTVRDHRQSEDAWRAQAIDQVLVHAPDVGIHHALSALLLRGRGPERVAAGELFGALGEASLPLLLGCVEQGSREARRLVAELAGPQWLADELTRGHRPASTLRLLAALLADKGAAEHARAVASLLLHGDSTVREAGLQALVHLRGEEALRACLQRLDDSAANVVERAIHLLEVLEHHSQAFNDRLLALTIAPEGQYPERLQVAAADALGRAKLDPAERARITAALVDRLPTFGESRWRIRRAPTAGRPAPRLRASMYRTLAALGEPACEQALTRAASRDPDTGAKAAAADALAEHKRRIRRAARAR